MIHPIKSDSKANYVYFSYYDDNGKKQHLVKEVREDYFYHSNEDKPIISVKAVQRQTCFPINKRKEAKEKINTYESDLPLHKRFLLDTFKNVKSIEKVDLRIAVIDIEVYMEEFNIKGDGEITAITVYDIMEDNIYTFAWHPTENYIDKENKIAVFDSEQKLIFSFCDLMGKIKFDIVTGWNVENFDIQFICERLLKLGMNDQLRKLSPFHNIVNENIPLVERKWGREEFKIIGLNIIDYLELYKKFAFKTLSSYSLQNVSMDELGEGKVDFDGNLNDLWKTDIKKYIEYNRYDVILVKKLEDKIKFLNLLDEIRRLGICNIDEALHITNVIDNLLIRFLNKSGLVVRSKRYSGDGESRSFAGAYVKEPKAGLYEWIIDNDYTSLYPFIIMNLNISPEAKLGKVISDDNVTVTFKQGTKIYKLPSNQFMAYLQQNDIMMAGNGTLFTKKTKGIFVGMLEWLYKKRKEYKKLKIENLGTDKEDLYETMQYAYKVLLNSFYGYVGFVGSRFFDIDLAEAVTLTGQKLCKFAERKAIEKGYNVITADTDSILFTGDNIKNLNDARRIGMEVSDYINKALIGWCKSEFNIDNCTFDLKQEIVARRGMFFKRKHYALYIINNEGKDTDYIMYKGISVKRADTSGFAKGWIKKIYETILKENDISKVKGLISEFKDAIIKAPVNEIGIPMSLTKKVEEYKKSIPINVRAALLWDENYSDKCDTTFKNSMKGKYYYLRRYPAFFKPVTKKSKVKEFDPFIGIDVEVEKNIVIIDIYDKKNPVIAVPEGVDVPPEFEVDYDLMIEKMVNKKLENLNSILSEI